MVKYLIYPIIKNSLDQVPKAQIQTLLKFLDKDPELKKQYEKSFQKNIKKLFVASTARNRVL